MAAYTSQTYKGKIDLQFQYGKKNSRIKIPNEQIIYIMIEEDYIDRVLPIIYISISVNNDTYNKIIDKRETSYFYLSISATDIMSHSSTISESFSGLFKYIPETTTTDFGANMNYAADSATDTSYRTINIGLVSNEQTEMLRKSFNGVYKDIDSSTLISLGLEDLKNVIVEPIENNVHYDQIIIPPVGSIYKFLDYIYKEDAFYNTPFRFFMSFNKTFLLSQRGEAFTNTNNSVIMKLEDITSDNSLVDGIIKKNGAYYMYLNAMDVKISSNQSTSQVVNNIVSYDDSSNETTSLDLNNSGSGRSVYTRTDYGNVLKNEIDSSDLLIDIMKKDIDGTIFTPEKKYSFSGSGENAKFNGTYLLNCKRIFYKSIGDEYNITCNLVFKPTSENTTAHKDSASLSNKATSQSAKKSSTSNAAKTSATTTSRAAYNK